MKKHLLTALLLSVFMSVSSVMPLRVIAKESNQSNVEASPVPLVIDKGNGTYAIDLSGQGLTKEEQLWDYFKKNKIHPESITDLNISRNRISGELDLNNLTRLYFLDCSDNQIEVLDVEYTPLVRINCSHNNMKQLNIPSWILTDENDQDFPRNIFDIKNDFSDQNVHIRANKGANTISFHENFPNNDPVRMKYKSEVKNSDISDQILNINSDQFSYKYEMSTNPAVNNKYLLDVTVHLDREESSSSFTNDPVNIADDVANGLVGKQDSSDTKSIHRLYNPNSGEHFYTSNTEERDYLVNVGWRSEGVGWVAPTISMAPVYRLYNPNAGDHHYTLDANERNDLQKYGWRYEGISFYSDEYHTVPLYRQYNPNAISGAHNFTTDKYENDYLISVGWRAEKIGWYALSKQ